MISSARSRFVIESIEPIWQVQVRDASVFPTALKPGTGPGYLVWMRVLDEGVSGIEARWSTGIYTILAITLSEFALFFEGKKAGSRLLQKCKVLQVGAVDELKIAASEHKRNIRPSAAAPFDHPELQNELPSGKRSHQNG
jgi:hypothetical protein